MKNAYAVRFGRELIRRFASHHVPDLSAQLSFYFLLSLFPFLVFTFALLAYIPISSQEVLTLIAQYVPANGMEIIERNVRSVLDVQRGGVLSISFIVAMWSASNGSHAVIRALNHAYDAKKPRAFLRGRLVAIFLMISMIVVIIMALLLPVFGKVIGLFLFTIIGFPEQFLVTWDIIRWTISSGVLFIVFSFLYYFAPNQNVFARDVWVGALFATIGWQLMSLAFSYYVNNFANFTAMYGSLGGIIMLLLWFFIGGMILIFGGEINATRKVLRDGHWQL